MKIKELANFLNTTVGEIRVQFGIEGDEVPPEIEEQVSKWSSQKSQDLPPEKEKKRGRPRKDTLVKKAASDLEDNAIAAGLAGASFVQNAAILKAQEMMSAANVVSATGYAAFTAQLAQNDSAFLQWFAKGTSEAVATNSEAINPADILAQLGVPTAEESLGKLQNASIKFLNPEEINQMRFYAD